MVSGVTIREVTYPPGRRQPTHAHAETSITLVFQGSLQEQVERSREQAGPLSLVVKPSGTPHSNHFGPAGARTLQLSFKPDARSLPAWTGNSANRWRWYHGGIQARTFLSLLEEFRSPRSKARLEAVMSDLFDSLGATNPERREDRPPEWLLRMREMIERGFGEEVRVRDLAESVRMHPVSLARSFRRHFGTSITEHLKGLRVRAAARLLSAPRPSIASVAYDCGFSDQSHLCRVFKSSTGLTPSRFRILAAPS